MQYRQLGNSDLKVSTVIFGAWAVGGWFWGGQDDQDSIDAIRAGVDAGINCIDTAPIYGQGHSEEVVGRAIKGIRDKVMIATKCALRWDVDESRGGCHGFDYVREDGSKQPIRSILTRESIFEELEGSLKRLGVDTIDLYQCHWIDTATPVEETMGALMDLRKQGKIRAIGVSNWTPELMAEAMKHGDLASDQPKYSLLYREIEQDVLPFCHTNNVGCIAWSPLEQGILTGKVTMDRKFAQTDLRMQMKPWFLLHNRKRVLEALDTIRPVARAHDATLGQVAIAWVAAQPGVTAAIVGARNVQQVTENARAGALTLSADELAHIRGVFENLAPPPEEANA